MNIRHSLLYILIAVIAVSCAKETTSNSNNGANADTFLNLYYGTEPVQSMDAYLPAGRKTASTKVMIMVHGGAWTVGDKSEFAGYVDTLKRRFPDAAIFNINYRLSAFPNNLFPAQEMDVKAAVEYIYNRRNEFVVSDNFVLIGASAGAHLSLLHAYKYATPVRIKAVVDFFGPTDMLDLYAHPGSVPQSAIANIVGATPTTNRALYQQSSPVYYVADTVCPTIILQGSADPLVNPVSQSQALRDKLQTAAVPVQYVEYAGKGHGDDWDNATFFDAFNKIEAFLSLHNP